MYRVLQHYIRSQTIHRMSMDHYSTHEQTVTCKFLVCHDKPVCGSTGHTVYDRELAQAHKNAHVQTSVVLLHCLIVGGPIPILWELARDPGLTSEFRSPPRSSSSLSAGRANFPMLCSAAEQDKGVEQNINSVYQVPAGKCV